jgi:hypothetical protein
LILIKRATPPAVLPRYGIEALFQLIDGTGVHSSFLKHRSAIADRATLLALF